MTINQRDHVVGLLDHEEWNLQIGRDEPEAAIWVGMRAVSQERV